LGKRKERRGGGGIIVSALAQDLVSLLFRFPSVILQACVVSLSACGARLPRPFHVDDHSPSDGGRPSSSAYLSSLLSRNSRARVPRSVLRLQDPLCGFFRRSRRSAFPLSFLKTVMFVIIMPADSERDSCFGRTFTRPYPTRIVRNGTRCARKRKNRKENIKSSSRALYDVARKRFYPARYSQRIFRSVSSRREKRRDQPWGRRGCALLKGWVLSFSDIIAAYTTQDYV